MSVVSQEIPQPLTTKINLKIPHLKFTLNIPGANELTLSSLDLLLTLHSSAGKVMAKLKLGCSICGIVV